MRLKTAAAVAADATLCEARAGLAARAASLTAERTALQVRAGRLLSKLFLPFAFCLL